MPPSPSSVSASPPRRRSLRLAAAASPIDGSGSRKRPARVSDSPASGSSPISRSNRKRAAAIVSDSPAPHSSPSSPIDVGGGSRFSQSLAADSSPDTPIDTGGERKCSADPITPASTASPVGGSRKRAAAARDSVSSPGSPVDGGQKNPTAKVSESSPGSPADGGVGEGKPAARVSESPPAAVSSPASPIGGSGSGSGSGKRMRAANISESLATAAVSPLILDSDNRKQARPAAHSSQSSPIDGDGELKHGVAESPAPAVDPSRDDAGTTESAFSPYLAAIASPTEGDSPNVLSQRRRSLRLASVEGDMSGDAGVGVAVPGPVDLPNVVANARSVRYSCDEKGKLDLEIDVFGNGRDEMVVDLTGHDEDIVSSGRRLTADEKGKGKLELQIGSLNDTIVDLTGDDEGRMPFGRRFSAEEKGKSKLVIERDWLSLGRNDDEVVEEKIIIEEMADIIEMDDQHAHFEGGSRKRRKSGRAKGRSEYRREADRSKALELAPKFALFKDDDDEDEEGEDPDEKLDGVGDEEWPGPFSTAMDIIDKREALLEARNAGLASKKVEPRMISWTPATNRPPKKRVPPSLKDLSLKVLCENVEEIESLEGVPDSLNQVLGRMLCNSMKMSARALGLLVSGSTAKILLTNGTWATDEQIHAALAMCNNETLQVVQLDLCGRGMTDYVLRDTLAQSPNCFLSLIRISLKGAYRLTDEGLSTIASSAPSLSSINLGQCSLLTAHGIISLANKLESVLRELYIDYCQTVDVMLILPALKKLQLLELLSVSHIPTVSNKFVKQFISFSGPNMKTLGFAGCSKLTHASMKIIGENCSRLCSLDLRQLNQLNDCAIGHITSGCRSLQKLKLCRNGFSDEAIAAFLEASGEALVELSLNKIEKVGEHTAVAISRRCSNLRKLDLSFSRMMSDDALGLIADSCPNLAILKLFGCTQVTNRFLEGHSNMTVRVIGLEEPILAYMEVPDSL